MSWSQNQEAAFEDGYNDGFEGEDCEEPEWYGDEYRLGWLDGYNTALALLHEDTQEVP